VVEALTALRQQLDAADCGQASLSPASQENGASYTLTFPDISDLPPVLRFLLPAMCYIVYGSPEETHHSQGTLVYIRIWLEGQRGVL
jgi:hypothetical protein